MVQNSTQGIPEERPLERVDANQQKEAKADNQLPEIVDEWLFAACKEIAEAPTPAVQNTHTAKHKPSKFKKMSSVIHDLAQPIMTPGRAKKSAGKAFQEYSESLTGSKRKSMRSFGSFTGKTKEQASESKRAQSDVEGSGDQKPKGLYQAITGLGENEKLRYGSDGGYRAERQTSKLIGRERSGSQSRSAVKQIFEDLEGMKGNNNSEARKIACHLKGNEWFAKVLKESGKEEEFAQLFKDVINNESPSDIGETVMLIDELKLLQSTSNLKNDPVINDKIKLLKGSIESEKRKVDGQQQVENFTRLCELFSEGKKEWHDMDIIAAHNLLNGIRNKYGDALNSEKINDLEQLIPKKEIKVKKLIKRIQKQELNKASSSKLSLDDLIVSRQQLEAIHEYANKETPPLKDGLAKMKKKLGEKEKSLLNKAGYDAKSAKLEEISDGINEKKMELKEKQAAVAENRTEIEELTREIADLEQKESQLQKETEEIKAAVKAEVAKEIQRYQERVVERDIMRMLLLSPKRAQKGEGGEVKDVGVVELHDFLKTYRYVGISSTMLFQRLGAIYDKLPAFARLRVADLCAEWLGSGFNSDLKNSEVRGALEKLIDKIKEDPNIAVKTMGAEMSIPSAGERLLGSRGESTEIGVKAFFEELQKSENIEQFVDPFVDSWTFQMQEEFANLDFSYITIEGENNPLIQEGIRDLVDGMAAAFLEEFNRDDVDKIQLMKFAASCSLKAYENGNHLFGFAVQVFCVDPDVKEFVEENGDAELKEALAKTDVFTPREAPRNDIRNVANVIQNQPFIPQHNSILADMNAMTEATAKRKSATTVGGEKEEHLHTSRMEWLKRPIEVAMTAKSRARESLTSGRAPKYIINILPAK